MFLPIFMVQEDNFKVGEYIIDSDQIFKVSKIDSDRLYYQPINTDGRYQTIHGSIPIKNVSSSGFRRLLSAKDFKNFIIELTKIKPAPEFPIDSKMFKETLWENDPFKIIPLLKQLWLQKNKPNVNFSGNNRDTLESILTHLTDEFSLVTKKSPESIRNRIINAISKKKN